MKPGSTRRRLLASLGAALLLVLLFLIALRGQRQPPPRRGESLPQFTGSPGITAKGQRIWGMPNRDLYTPVNSPRYVSAAAAREFLSDSDRVFVIRKEGSTYVYPEVLLTSYHVVNDVIGGEPLAVTYCLLAGSACRFSRRLEDRVLTLGLTGQIFAGNSVLHDEETETDWLQLNGEPIQGHYYGRVRLEGRPLEQSSFGRVRHEKDVKVLAPLADMEQYRSFKRDMESSQLGRKVVESQTKLDPRLLPYTVGLGVVVQGEAVFFPEDVNGAREARNDRAGG